MREALTAMAPPNARHPRPISEGRPKALNTLGTFAHHPELAQAFLTFNGHVMLGTTLSLRQRDPRAAGGRGPRVRLRMGAARAARARRRPRRRGDRAASPVLDAPWWSELEAALIRSVDELVYDGAIGEATWAALAAELDTRQIMDVIFTVGAYQTLATMMRSFELELDDDLKRD